MIFDTNFNYLFVVLILFSVFYLFLQYKSNLVSEVERLLIVEELNNKEITPKIKKTFKNRYFLKVN